MLLMLYEFLVKIIWKI